MPDSVGRVRYQPYGMLTTQSGWMGAKVVVGSSVAVQRIELTGQSLVYTVYIYSNLQAFRS